MGPPGQSAQLRPYGFQGFNEFGASLLSLMIMTTLLYIVWSVC